MHTISTYLQWEYASRTPRSSSPFAHFVAGRWCCWASAARAQVAVGVAQLYWDQQQANTGAAVAIGQVGKLAVYRSYQTSRSLQLKCCGLTGGRERSLGGSAGAPLSSVSGSLLFAMIMVAWDFVVAGGREEFSRNISE